MFHYLDVVISFAVLILVASLFITAATQVAVSLLGLRGGNLRRSLADLLETAYPDQETRQSAKEIAGRVLRDPTISGSVFSHLRLRAEGLPFLPPETAGKLQSVSASIPLFPCIVGGVGGFFLAPVVMAISKGLFGGVICQYSDVLASYVSAVDFCNHPWRTGLIAGVILGGLLSRWRLATSVRVEELPAVLEKLAEPLPGTLPDPAQRAMLRIAWNEKEPGARSRAGAEQMREPLRSKSYFDERIVGRGTKASLQNQTLFPASADFDEGIVRHAEPVETESSVVVAEEHAEPQADEREAELGPAAGTENAISTAPEPHAEGLRAWFDNFMDRASQRFSVQARLVAVVLSCVFVFGWHFDAVRLLQSMSQSAELRARLAATAEGLDKQAEQLPRSKQGARTIVPEAYRQAMVSVLRPVSAEPSANNQDNEARPSGRRRQRAKEREKAAAPAAPTEDSATTAARSRAMHEIETVPGFASREDAEDWLRTTLGGNAAREKLAAAYQQEVNAELVSDSDRLIDQSASLKSELARSQFKLFQDEHSGAQSWGELPGLLVTIALLSLGATFWYNTLRNLASLRPRLATKQEQN
ncbi:MAG TPA: hypothetical protein VJN89_02230 [Candidatus Acidoferrum sp.]|nr:hypothetical protein [Candidatus Acidoferrum sp.]